MVLEPVAGTTRGDETSDTGTFRYPRRSRRATPNDTSYSVYSTMARKGDQDDPNPLASRGSQYPSEISNKCYMSTFL